MKTDFRMSERRFTKLAVRALKGDEQARDILRTWIASQYRWVLARPTCPPDVRKEARDGLRSIRRA